MNLSKKHFEIIGFDKDHSSFDTLKDFNITKKNNLDEVVKETNIIFTMLPDGPIVKEVWDHLIS